MLLGKRESLRKRQGLRRVGEVRRRADVVHAGVSPGSPTFMRAERKPATACIRVTRRNLRLADRKQARSL
jgi:hypothetical protein